MIYTVKKLATIWKKINQMEIIKYYRKILPLLQTEENCVNICPRNLMSSSLFNHEIFYSDPCQICRLFPAFRARRRAVVLENEFGITVTRFLTFCPCLQFGREEAKERLERMLLQNTDSNLIPQKGDVASASTCAP